MILLHLAVHLKNIALPSLTLVQGLAESMFIGAYILLICMNVDPDKSSDMHFWTEGVI